MKKIPTLFERIFERNKIVGITDKVTPGCECVLKGETLPTVKIDGACCAIIRGELYKRYDAKKGKRPPEGAIPCESAPDPITGHWPHWVKCSADNPSDKWFLAAFQLTSVFALPAVLSDGTYEAVGPHFQGNPYNLREDRLVKHGKWIALLDDTTFEGIKKFLATHRIEGIVFWQNGEPLCKIKRTDFGLEWPVIGGE